METKDAGRGGFVGRTLSEMFFESAAAHPEVMAVEDPHGKPPGSLTYGELAQAIRCFAAGLLALGVHETERVAVLADNRPRWIISDLALLSLGAITVPRGSDTATQEIWYILNHSESLAAIVQDKRLYKRIFDMLTPAVPVQDIILMDDSAEELSAPAGVNLHNFSDVSRLGEANLDKLPGQMAKVKPGDVATIVYTSGTTGIPKGVMLTHANMSCQADTLSVGFPLLPGMPHVVILPSWHAYERIAEYLGLRYGTTLFYSDKRWLRDDLMKRRPQILPCVPRIWESIYDVIHDRLRKQPKSRQQLFHFFVKVSLLYVQARRRVFGLEVRKTPASTASRVVAGIKMGLLWPIHAVGDKLLYSKIRAVTGGRLLAAVNGGGSLGTYLDDFFEALGVPMLNGYGLTEAGPVLTLRTTDRNVRHTVGRPTPHTQLEIRDEASRVLPQGETGIIWAKGPQIMAGYYKNPEEARRVIDEKGWLNTGDLGWITCTGDLVISGRAKDTIVLSSGENVEPEPIEGCVRQSPYVSQVIIVGQDQKALGALIYPNVSPLAEALGLDPHSDIKSVLAHPEALKVVRESVNAVTAARRKYTPQEQIAKVVLLEEPFSEANGMMTQTLKPKRNVILRRYKGLIDSMFRS